MPNQSRGPGETARFPRPRRMSQPPRPRPRPRRSSSTISKPSSPPPSVAPTSTSTTCGGSPPSSTTTASAWRASRSGWSRAREAAEQHEEAQLEEGVKLVHRALAEVLRKEGLEEIETDGRFDPHVHEALLSQPS